MANSAASCVQVSKSYLTGTGRVDALRGVDAEFPKGAVSAVVGASGSGKSTLLRLLAALDRPTGGRVLLGSLELGGLSASRLRFVRRTMVGYVFQRPSDNFVPELTLGEHIRLAGGDAESTGNELLASLGLEDRVQHRPEELSGGEQQRAAIAQALAAGPRLIVADEPTAELDARSSADLLAAVRELAEGGVAFVIATHDRAVTAIADHAFELEHGLVRGGPVALHREHGPPLPRTRAAGPVVVELERVTKSYRRGDEPVLGVADVDLRVRAGELTALVGRSGSGKTTILNLIAGWEKPDVGTVSFPGLPGATDPARLPWAEVGVLPQRFGLIPELTVRGNVEYPARLAGRLADTGPWIRTLLETLALGELADRFPAETSIGQQQRTALARALALRPHLLLADEPTGHQDARSASAILGALHDAADGGTACLVATHDEELASRFDTVFPLGSGRLLPETHALGDE